MYGRLKRKTSSRGDFSLSPTKHTVRNGSWSTPESSLSSSSSVFSSSDSFGSADWSQSSTFSECRKSSSLELSQNAAAGEEANKEPRKERTFSSQQATHSAKSKPAGMLDPVFNGFEDLEESDFRCTKSQKLSEGTKNNSRTTLFNKTLQHQAKNNSRTAFFHRTLQHQTKHQTDTANSTDIDGEDEQELSENEFSSEMSESLQMLNSRISELQSKINVTEVSDDSGTQMSKSHYLRYSNSSLRHYGNTRTYKMEEQSLSAENSDVEELPNEDDPVSDTKSELLTKCQSLNELRAPAEMETSKIDFEMMIEQIERWIGLGSTSREIVLVKLDLVTKYNTDKNFGTYLKKNIIGNNNSYHYKILKQLVDLNKDIMITNLQIIKIFKISDIDIGEYIREITEAGNISIDSCIHKELNSTNKLIRDMSRDWLSTCPDSSSYAVFLTMLLSLNTSFWNTMSESHQGLVLKFIETSFQTLNKDLMFLSTKLLRDISPSLRGSNIVVAVEILQGFFLLWNQQEPQTCNNILQSCITISCLSEDIKVREHLFTDVTWDRSWDSFCKNNIFQKKTKLSEVNQNLCLYSIGYLFNFISTDFQIARKDGLKRLKDLLNFNVELDGHYSALQLHCFGYFGCIAHHFLANFDSLEKDDFLKIKIMCQLYKRSAINSEEPLNTQINQILELMS